MSQVRTGREIIESLPVNEATRGKRRGGAVRAALTEVTLAGDFAQFGVFKGGTARKIEAAMSGPRKLHLFDSFEGLPENWTRKKQAGAFRLAPEDIPVFDSERVAMHKGWFKDTVPVWAKQRQEPLAFIHMDADLYSSTVDVLFNIDRLIAAETIILFDEYVMGKTDDEHRALLDWARQFNRRYTYLWRDEGPRVCIRVEAA